MSDLEVEEGGRSSPIQCACCGYWSQSVNGYVHEGEQTVAAYFVQWTAGNLAHDPNIDLVVGQWGDGTTAADRQGVSLMYRVGQGFMVIDADARPFSGGQALFSHALKRSDVVGTGLAAAVFRIIDAIWLQDSRIEELRMADSRSLQVGRP